MSMLPVGFGASGDYTIEESLRFNASQSSYLSWTPASAGNRKTWTWSGWVKRGTLGAGLQSLFVAIDGSATNYVQISISSDKLYFYANPLVSGGVVLTTTQVMRDPSAWMHIIAVLDTTNATPADRAKLYINGVRVTSFTTNNAASITLNADAYLNAAVQHNIGNRQPFGNALFDGYITEVNFIDGQALDASSFGEYNADTGVWQPIKYTGTYGTNGFYLNFSDASTTTTLGYDYSGQSNNWLLNNFSLTGTAYCSMTDTPTPYLGGGNYCTLNPLDKYSNVTLSNANLSATFSAYTGFVRSTFALPSTGKWYWECTVPTTDVRAEFGIATLTQALGVDPQGASGCWFLYSNGTSTLKFNGSGTSWGTAWVSGDIIGVAFDSDAGTLTFYKNNILQGGGAAFTGLTGTYSPMVGFGNNTSTAISVNFGQRPFTYTPPTGFKALHTGNLPDSSIVDGSKHFDAVTWTSDGTDQFISTGFDPDFLWYKSRTQASDHYLIDVLRSGALNTNNTDAEGGGGGSSNLGTGGFTINAASSGNNIVGWNWKAGGTGVSNTDGSITSTVSANPTAGFSIVSYTGTGANATVGHSLGTAPSMVIVKGRTAAYAGAWTVWHQALGADYYLFLELTDPKSTTATPFNDTAPTSTVFSIDGSARVNTNTQNYIAYCFAEVEGYSKFGSYVGNGGAGGTSGYDGPFVYTGFRPSFVLVKNASSGWNGIIWDAKRDTYNQVNGALIPNLSSAEYDVGGYMSVDFLSNGFKIRSNDAQENGNGNTLIYMAFAENPFKNSLAR